MKLFSNLCVTLVFEKKFVLPLSFILLFVMASFYSPCHKELFHAAKFIKVPQARVKKIDKKFNTSPHPPIYLTVQNVLLRSFTDCMYMFPFFVYSVYS